MEQWELKKLDEMAEVSRGKSRHRPRNEPLLYDGPYPFIQTADIHNSELYITSYSQTYSEAGLAQSKFWPANTLCITIAGENTGDCGILSFGACFPDSIIGVSPDPTKSDVRFLKYSLDTIKPLIRTITKGATQDNLSVAKLLSFNILSPPLVTQKKIASVLSSYDDLIENNEQRIKILEDMVQSIYGEWFVNYRFPGHQDFRMVDSELGQIPEGWEIKTLGDVASLVRRGVKPSDNPSETFAHYSIPAFDGGKRPSMELGESIKSTKYLVVDDCVLVSKLNPRIKRVWLPKVGSESRSIASTEFLMLEPRATMSVELLFSMCFSDKFITQLASGASGTSTSHQRLKPEQVMSTKRPLPPTTLIEIFTDHTTPIVSEGHSLTKMNQNLRQTRDLLLPKLISGELDVDAMDISVA